MRAKVGVSHHVSFMRPYGLFDISAVALSDQMTRFPFIDEICHKLDFIGINYYGQVRFLKQCIIVGCFFNKIKGLTYLL